MNGQGTLRDGYHEDPEYPTFAVPSQKHCIATLAPS